MLNSWMNKRLKFGSGGYRIVAFVCHFAMKCQIHKLLLVVFRCSQRDMHSLVLLG